MIINTPWRTAPEWGNTYNSLQERKRTRIKAVLYGLAFFVGVVAFGYAWILNLI